MLGPVRSQSTELVAAGNELRDGWPLSTRPRKSAPKHMLSLSDWVIPLPRGVCGGHRNFLFHQALDASTTSLLTSGLHV